MKTIRISGYSDDVVVAEGGELTDEGSGPFVELSTGDVFRADYCPEGSECWEVEHVVKGQATSVEIVRKLVEDDDGYTGHATVTGPIEWVEFWGTWPPEAEDVRNKIDAEQWRRRPSQEQLIAAYRILAGHVPVPQPETVEGEVVR